MMLRTLAFAVLLLSTPAMAQTLPGATPETRAAAQELVQALHAERLYMAMLGTTRREWVIQVQRTGKSEADASTIVDEVLMPELRSRIGEFVDSLSAIWASQLSVDEMHAIRDFYATPVGQKLLAVQPTVAALGATAWRVWGDRVIQEALTKHAEELRKRGVVL